MSSGPTQVVINPSERAVSDDINRMQKLSAQAWCELWRATVDTALGSDDLDAAGVEQQNTAQLSPDSATIFSGLRVVPSVGTNAISITAGTIAMLDPDATPDPNDSPLKLISDAGSSGSLSIAPNSSGQTRIDVIECARVSAGVNVLETDSRDIYNNATGLFTPANVNKIIAGALQYRVRSGGTGAGFPGTATGWVPLAVASVPTGTSTNDAVTFWDVRPMACDRVVAPFNATRDLPLSKPGATISVRVSGAQSLCTGHVEVTPTDQATPKAGMRRLGGRLRRGTPGSDLPATGVDGLDLADAANQSGSASNATNYLYLLEPFGLPRWARYTDATTGTRKPRSPRGIPVVSATQPVHLYGSPLAAITLPTSTGLGGSTSMGVAVLALGTVGATTQPAGASLSGGRGSVDASAAGFLNTSVAGNVATAGKAIFTLIDNVTHPPFARGLDVSIELVYSTGHSGALALVTNADLVDQATGEIICSVGRNVMSSTYLPFGGSGAVMGLSMWIPLPADYAHGVTAATRNLVVNFTCPNDAAGIPAPVNSATLKINGWNHYV